METHINISEYIPDLSLTLTDGTNKKTINVNRDVLCFGSDYFKCLLGHNFVESKTSEVTITVPNIDFAVYFIISLHNNFPANETIHIHILESIRLRDFFGLNYSTEIQLLHKLKIPEEDYDLLLETVNIIGYTDEMVMLLYENLPKKYNIPTLQKDLLKELIAEISRRNKLSDLNNTKQNVIRKFEEYGLDHDEFMENLSKYGYVYEFFW